MLTLNNGATGDKLAAKQDVGTDVLYEINGDDVQTSPADTYGVLAQGALSTTATALIGPASGHSYIVDDFKLTNTGTSTRTITLYKTKNSATYDATTQWGSTIVLAANESAEWTGAGWLTYDSLGQPRVALGGGPGKVVNVFNGTTTYTPSTGTRALYVECIGAGGGGGGGLGGSSLAGVGSGGGGGAYSAVYTTVIKSSFTVAVGLGGTAGAATPTAGSAGGDTTFDSASICTAKGGSGGTVGVTAGSGVIVNASTAGGLSTSGVGDIKADGGSGMGAIRLSGTVALGGNGGDSAFGGGGAGKIVAGQTVGGLYGGGGSGGTSLTTTGQAGGTGGNGLLRITEFQ